MTPVSVDRTTLFYGTYVPERDPMDLMQCVVDIAIVGLVSITVIGVIAVTVMAAKAAKNGSHGCAPVVTEEEEEDRSEWEVGTCVCCNKQKEIYYKFHECESCLHDNFLFGRDECDPDSELKRLRQRCFDLESQIVILEARIHWMGSNPFGD